MIYTADGHMTDAVQFDKDYVNSASEIVEHVPAKEVIIRTEDDLALLTDYPVGTIAYVTGLTKLFILSAYNQWVELGTEEDIPSESESESSSESESESASESESESEG